MTSVTLQSWVDPTAVQGYPEVLLLKHPAHGNALTVTKHLATSVLFKLCFFFRFSPQKLFLEMQTWKENSFSISQVRKVTLNASARLAVLRHEAVCSSKPPLRHSYCFKATWSWNCPVPFVRSSAKPCKALHRKSQWNCVRSEGGGCPA